MKPNKTPESLVFGALNKIYRTSRDIAKEWGTKYIGLNTFKELIDLSKHKDFSDMKEHKQEYNKLLDILYTTCANQSKKLESSNVSVKFIKYCVEHIKDNM